MARTARAFGVPLRIALLLVLIASFLWVREAPGSTEAGVPVANSEQHIYRPGVGVGSQSAELSDEEKSRYLVPPLQLQGIKIGQTAAEPTIGVDESGTAFFAASTMVVDTDFVWGVAETDVHRSTDGGLNWESVQLKVPVTEDSIIPGNADPFVYVDQDTGRVFNIDLYAACSWLNFSDDKGETWTPSPLACGNPVNDHHTIATGPPPANLTTIEYPNVVYYCFNRVIDAACGRSLDGGLTWTPTLAPHVPPTGNDGCSKLHGHIRTDSEGRLFVPLGRCGGDPWVAISEDGGDSWTRVEVSQIDSANTHTSLAVDTEDNLYYVWYESETRLPYVAYSTDHGATWSEAFMVGPPGVTEVNFPTIAAGQPGHVAVNFPSSIDDDRSGNSRPWNQTVTVTYNLLEEDPIFHSATGNDPADPIHRGNCNGRCAGLWDFLDVTIAPSGGEAWAAASDDCVGSCVGGAATAAKAGDGLAIRQIGGPCLLPPADPDAASCDTVPETRWLPAEG